MAVPGVRIVRTRLTGFAGLQLHHQIGRVFRCLPFHRPFCAGDIRRRFLDACKSEETSGVTTASKSPAKTSAAQQLVEQSGGQVLRIGPVEVKQLQSPGLQENLTSELPEAFGLAPGTSCRLRHLAFKEAGGFQFGWCERVAGLQEQRILHGSLVLYGHATCCSISGELRLDGATEDPPPGYTVTQDGRCFAVLPWRAPDDSDLGTDMIKAFDDNWMDIPAGWRPYEACQDFDRMVLPNVIAANSWGTDMVLVRRGNKWPGWKTGVQGAAAGAGKRLSSHVDWFETDGSGRRCVFRAEDPQRTPSKKLDPMWRSWSGRVLLERIPDSCKISAFKTLLRLHAQDTCLRDDRLPAA